MKTMRWFASGVILGLMALCALAPTEARALDDVTLRLHWQVNGTSAGWFLGLERGYFEQEGIKLTVSEGKGSVVAAQVVASKGDTFGTSDASSVMQVEAKGASIKAVMSIVNKGAWSVLIPADSPIKTLKDLEGKKIGVTAGDALTQLWPIVVRANNLDASKIDLVYLDSTAKVVALMTHKVDAMLAGFVETATILKTKGFDVRWLAFSDYGVNTVQIAVVAHEDTIKNNPDMVRRFVRAASRTYAEYAKDPEAGAKAVMKYHPEASYDSIAGQAKLITQLFETPATKGHPVGWAATEDWERTLAALKEGGQFQSDRPAASYFTNDFIPK